MPCGSDITGQVWGPGCSWVGGEAEAARDWDIGLGLCQHMRMNAENEASRLVSAEDIALAAEVLALLSDPTRIRLVLALEAATEMSVGELAATVDRAPSSVSQHLARLRMARMVTTRHEGTRVLYKLADEHALRVIREAIKQAEHSVAAAGQIPLHHTSDA